MRMIFIPEVVWYLLYTKTKQLSVNFRESNMNFVTKFAIQTTGLRKLTYILYNEYKYFDLQILSLCMHFIKVRFSVKLSVVLTVQFTLVAPSRGERLIFIIIIVIIQKQRPSSLKILTILI